MILGSEFTCLLHKKSFCAIFKFRAFSCFFENCAWVFGLPCVSPALSPGLRGWDSASSSFRGILGCFLGDQGPYGEPSIHRLIEALDSCIEQPQRDLAGPFLMPIDNLVSVPGRGTIAIGKSSCCTAPRLPPVAQGCWPSSWNATLFDQHTTGDFWLGLKRRKLPCLK